MREEYYRLISEYDGVVAIFIAPVSAFKFYKGGPDFSDEDGSVEYVAFDYTSYLLEKVKLEKFDSKEAALKLS